MKPAQDGLSDLQRSHWFLLKQYIRWLNANRTRRLVPGWQADIQLRLER